jgi:hypothetical protein
MPQSFGEYVLEVEAQKMLESAPIGILRDSGLYRQFDHIWSTIYASFWLEYSQQVQMLYY